MERHRQPADLKLDPVEQGKKVRMGKLKAKLSRTADEAERKKIQGRIDALERGEKLPEDEKPGGPASAPLGESDFQDISDSIFEAVAGTGLPLKRSPLGERFIVEGFSKMAKRKGWKTDDISEGGLIMLGLGLIVIQQVPLWIKLWKEKSEEKKNGPKVQPDASDRPDGGRKDDASAPVGGAPE